MSDSTNADIKILDFGFARMIDNKESELSSQAGTLCYEGMELVVVFVCSNNSDCST